jgi:phosphatidylserine/phosphatidylglycerophosphate/cardiolipin synthase-like enzyme
MRRKIIKKWAAFVFIAGVFMTGACDLLLAFEQAPTPVPPVSSSDVPGDWYAVYFSDPDDPASSSYRGGPDEALAESIRNARVSVDAAMHFMNLWSIRDAMIDAHRRGVQVRIVTESDNLDVDEIQELKAAGIQVIGDEREGRMHNKFVVIDRQEVWTGSTNLSVKGAYFHDNNLIRIHSPRLAQNYSVEFEEMFLDDRFGPGSPANNPNPSFTENNTQFESYFSPEDKPSRRIEQLLGQAQDSIYFLVYSFTLDDLADEMIHKARRGVTVSGVFDKGQSRSNAGTEYDRLRSAGVDVRLDGNKNKMHHKVIIIDEQVVITGSYNFSVNADRINDENLLVIHNRDIAQEYIREFERVYSHSSP